MAPSIIHWHWSVREDVWPSSHNLGSSLLKDGVRLRGVEWFIQGHTAFYHIAMSFELSFADCNSVTYSVLLCYRCSIICGFQNHSEGLLITDAGPCFWRVLFRRVGEAHGCAFLTISQVETPFCESLLQMSAVFLHCPFFLSREIPRPGLEKLFSICVVPRVLTLQSGWIFWLICTDRAWL